MNAENTKLEMINVTTAGLEVAPCPNPHSLEHLVPEPVKFPRLAGEENIKGVQKQLHFVRRRSEGATYAVIAKELGVSPGTLVTWSRLYRRQIQNLRSMRMEALQYEALSAPELRVRQLARHLAAVEAELDKRNIGDLPTSRLFSLADILRRRIVQETGSPTFSETEDDAIIDEPRAVAWKG